MGTTQTAAFTTSGTWTCPAGVTAVFLTAVGGGGGSPGAWNTISGFGGSGGAGSGEAIMNKMISVVPATVYSITIGGGGAGTAYLVHSFGGNPTSCFGFRALGASTYPQAFVGDTGLCGTGGGPGGGLGSTGGGRDPRPSRECRHWTGGGAGGGYSSAVSLNAMVSDGSSVLGGTISPRGTNTANPGSPGGPGGGAYWGGNSGGTDGEDHSDTNVSHYGSGAPGVGAQIPGNPAVNGTSGAPGYVLLMWIA